MQAWAVVENGKPLESIQVPYPEPQGAQVVLEVLHCGVCHSDLHLWDGHYELGEGKRMLVKDRGVTLPLVLGHEIVGRVVQTGPAAEGVRVGDVRIVYPWLGCATCAMCRADKDNMCQTPRSMGIFQNGGYATHVIVPEPRHLIDPGDLPLPVAATYACSGLTAYSAVKKALPLEPDEPIVVIGVGGLGGYAIAILRALGHRKIVAVDLNAGNRTLAKEAGASDTVDANEQPLAEAIVRACGGGIAAALDFVNNAATSRAAFEGLRRFGKLVQVGFFGGELTLPLPLMPMRALTIVGSYVGTPADLRELVELGQGGKLPPIPLATVPSDRVNDVLRDMREGRITGRVVLDSAAANVVAGHANGTRPMSERH